MITHRMTIQMVVFVSMVFLFTGCAKLEYQVPVVEDSKRVSDRHYEIDKRQTVSAGDTMMEAEDYWAIFRSRLKMKPSNNFRIEGSGGKHSGSESDLYDVILATNTNNTLSYYVVIPGLSEMYGIDHDGKWMNKVHLGGGRIQNAELFISPRNITFEKVMETYPDQFDSSRGFKHFEIIFSGKTKDAIDLLYQEYASDKPDRTGSPTFQEKLSFPADSEILRYKRISIKVHDVTHESISYTVLEDGLSKIEGSGIAGISDWSFILIADNSGSMSPEYRNMKMARTGVALKLMRDINNEIPEINAPFGVQTFGPAKVFQPLVPFDREAVSQAIEAIPTDFKFDARPTGMGSGLLSVDASLGGRKGNIAVIIITDGESNVGPKADEVMTELYEKYYDRISFHFITLGTKGKEKKFVESLAGLNSRSIIIDAEELMDYTVRANFIEKVFSPAN